MFSGSSSKSSGVSLSLSRIISQETRHADLCDTSSLFFALLLCSASAFQNAQVLHSIILGTEDPYVCYHDALIASHHHALLFSDSSNGRMEMQIAPCAACQNQLSARRRAAPHPRLTLLATYEARGAMWGGHEEFDYRCEDCGTRIHHTNDKNEFTPFWWIMKDATP
jgi:hypothetical protein